MMLSKSGISIFQGKKTKKIRKTNISPENQWLEDVFPIKIVPFLGDLLVTLFFCWRARPAPGGFRFGM